MSLMAGKVISARTSNSKLSSARSTVSPTTSKRLTRAKPTTGKTISRQKPVQETASVFEQTTAEYDQSQSVKDSKKEFETAVSKIPKMSSVASMDVANVEKWIKANESILSKPENIQRANIVLNNLKTRISFMI